jgi:hypothetical protein
MRAARLKSRRWGHTTTLLQCVRPNKVNVFAQLVHIDAWIKWYVVVVICTILKVEDE